ncbi:hypothetical protein [Streptomyces sp. P3]
MWKILWLSRVMSTMSLVVSPPPQVSVTTASLQFAVPLSAAFHASGTCCA